MQIMEIGSVHNQAILQVMPSHLNDVWRSLHWSDYALLLVIFRAFNEIYTAPLDQKYNGY